MTERRSALEGFRVLDLSESVAGQYCCRMLADYGADVILVEPPGGSVTRRMPPLRPVAAGEPKSYLFENVNRGKSSVVLDQGTPDGLDGLLSLIRTADALIVPAGFDRKRARAANPDCIINTVSPFGENTPLSHWRGEEMIYQALSGMMIHNGRNDRKPLYGIGQRASYCAGIAAYTTTLAALMHRQRTGEAQDVAVDVAHAAASMTFPFALQHSYNGSFEERDRRGEQLIEVEARDCWIAIFIRANMFETTCEALGAPQLITDSRFTKDTDRRANFHELIAEVQALVADRIGADVVGALQARKVVAACSYTPAQLGPEAPHLKQRDYWETVATGQGPRLALGPQFRMSGTPRAPARPAPALGEARTTGRRADMSSVPFGSASGISMPLSGLRIVEVTTAWAGPMAGRILAYLGAEVIHVEAPGQLDSWRSYSGSEQPRRYPDLVGGVRRYNRSAMFNSQNTDKLSLTLNLRSDQGKAIFKDLVGKADGLLTNFTPGMLGRLGFGNEELARINPRLCIVEMPAFGNTGTMRSWTALGPTMEQVAGMAAMIGYGDGRPVSTGPYYLDPIGAFNGSAAMMTALLHQQLTGAGQHVEVPQVEAAMHLVGELLMRAVETGDNPSPDGNRSPDMAPHDAFPARGDDEWVAIAVATDDEWRALCKVIGNDALANDPALATAKQRIARQDEIDKALSARTRTFDKHELAHALQNAGVAAAPLYKANDTLACAYLNARAFSIPLDHPDAGRHLHQGLPYRFEKTPLRHRSAAPCLGQHNHYILADVLGLGAAQIAALERDRVIATTPDK